MGNVSYSLSVPKSAMDLAAAVFSSSAFVDTFLEDWSMDFITEVLLGVFFAAFGVLEILYITIDFFLCPASCESEARKGLCRSRKLDFLEAL